MEMIAFLIVIGITIVSLFIEAWVLHVLLKIFRTKSPDYKNAFIVIIILWVVAVIIGYMISLLANTMSLMLYGNIAAIILVLVVFHLLLKKFFQTGFLKNIVIYILFSFILTVLAVVAIMPLRTYVIEPFYAQGASMEPAIEDNDYLLGLKFAKDFERGDIVMFKYTNDENQIMIKRIVGLPGDRLMFKENEVLVYNKDFPNGVKLNENDYLSSDIVTTTLNGSDFTLSETQYFVLGDDREKSLDSRRFGPIDEELIIAKYWLTLPIFNNQITNENNN